MNNPKILITGGAGYIGSNTLVELAKCYADSSYAKEVLGWEATRTIEQMCIDSWKWQSQSPNGYSNG